MRVLVLCHELPPIGGGGGRIALELARRMAAAGHEIEIVAPAHSNSPRREEMDGLLIHRLPGSRRSLASSSNREKLAFVWSALQETRTLRRRAHFDLVHSHFILPAGAIARWGAADLPHVITCHGSDVPGHNPYESHWEHRLSRPWWRAIVGAARAVVSPSENLAQLLRQAMPTLGTRLHHIPNGYPYGRLPLSRREPQVLMVSRLIPLKGFQWFLQGLAGVDLGYEVHIVGDGPMRPELEQLAAQTPTRVIFHGWLDNDSAELKDLFAAASIFVFPSEAENFPTVLLEAMDAGLAIVTTDVKGCPEVVGDMGVLVPPRAPEPLVQAVQSLIAAPDRIAQLGDQGRERLNARFDWPHITEQYDSLYKAAAHV